jgi:lysophospholipase L1-like esterase
MGDSFTEGYGAEIKKEQGYAYLLAKATGWNATIAGVGGTGFSWGGGKDGTAGNTYLQRLKVQSASGLEPEMVILQGGSNDYRADTAMMVTAVQDTVAYAHKAWPKAQVLVIAPMPVQPHGKNLSRVAQAMLAGASSSGAFYIDPNGLGWLTIENTPQYAFTDGAHVNTAGHAYLASKIKETLDAYAAAG